MYSFRFPLNRKLEGSYSNIAPTVYQRHTFHSHSVCTNNCASVKSTYINSPSIPHSKSLDHYNEPTKVLEHHNISRHSFDQPFSSKHYDCPDRIGHYAGSGIGNYHQPNCNLPLMTTVPFPDNHYSQIGNFGRGNNFVESTVGGSCCHQNYECVNNYNARTRSTVDYSNCDKISHL